MPCSIIDLVQHWIAHLPLDKMAAISQTTFLDAIDIYLNDLNNAPFMICNVFDDPDDKAWCFTKLLSDVMEKNAPSKTKIIKKPSVPFMNSNLRKAMHKRNMLRNKYRKGLQGLKLTLIPRSDFLLLLSKSWSKSDRHRSYFLSLKADIWLDWVAKLCS